MLLEPSALLQSELGAGSNMVYQKTEGRRNKININETRYKINEDPRIRILMIYGYWSSLKRLPKLCYINGEGVKPYISLYRSLES